MDDRLLNILKHYDLSPSSFADKIGVQRSSISHLLSGRNKPSFDFLSRMILYFSDLNIDWFITGKGNMLKKQSTAPVNLSLFDMNNISENQPETKTLKPNVNSSEQKEKVFTDVNNEDAVLKKRVSKIVLFYQDKTWEEFLPSDS